MDEARGNHDGESAKPGDEAATKLRRVLGNWMEKKVPLVVQPGEEAPVMLIPKHAVNYVERKR